MNTLFEFKLTEIPPPKKNRYRKGRKNIYHDTDVENAINICTESLKKQWRNRGVITDRMHIDIRITKNKKYPDDINIMETIYDCFEDAKIIRNDNLFTSSSHISRVDKMEDPLITIYLSPAKEWSDE